MVDKNGYTVGKTLAETVWHDENIKYKRFRCQNAFFQSSRYTTHYQNTPSEVER